MVSATDRAATRERLRRLIREIESRPSAPRPFVHRPVVADAPQLRFAAEWREVDGALMREREYPAEYLHGAQSLGGGDIDGELLALLGGGEELARATAGDLVFLDIEATGLGGAGAMVFLVASGRWESGGFRLRQYLAPAPPAEAGLLRQVIAACRTGSAEPVLVTYNGTTYDAPMLDARGTMHRLRMGFDAMSHLDLLKTVRRGIRDALRPHRLSHIEAVLLGLRRPEGEVSGADVPGWYFRFLRTGDARMLTPIVEHNAADVLSLAALLTRLAAVHGRAEEGGHLERLLLGRLRARQGRIEEALAHLEAARGLTKSVGLRHTVAMESARLLRRAGRRLEAAALWREVAGGEVAAGAALVELAKHHEHHERDLERALAAVERALALRGPEPALLHRRQRLLRKTAVAAASGGAAIP
ncbi:MAG: ribonuclease H-like domain-containing protein [Dehalococcoidia bacterium]